MIFEILQPEIEKRQSVEGAVIEAQVGRRAEELRRGEGWTNAENRRAGQTKSKSAGNSHKSNPQFGQEIEPGRLSQRGRPESGPG